jgi:hypothetical protein
VVRKNLCDHTQLFLFVAVCVCVCARSFVLDEQNCCRIEDDTTAYSTAIIGRQFSERKTHFFPFRPLFRLVFSSFSFVVTECILLSIVYADAQLKSKICCSTPLFCQPVTFVICVLRINLGTRCHRYSNLVGMMRMIVMVNSFPLSLFYIISTTT